MSKKDEINNGCGVVILIVAIVFGIGSIGSFFAIGLVLCVIAIITGVLRK